MWALNWYREGGGISQTIFISNDYVSGELTKDLIMKGEVQEDLMEGRLTEIDLVQGNIISDVIEGKIQNDTIKGETKCQ